MNLIWRNALLTWDEIKNQFFNMDCMELMKQIPDKMIDLGIIDPPYGIKRFKKGSLRFDKNNTYKNGLKTFINDTFERNDMYMDELKHFLHCVNGKEKPKITHTDIIDVMRIIDEVKI